jgi:biopolymer transport protein ExbD
MAEMDTSGGGHKKGPGVKKQVKKSTKVDLTPMVDLGFLLITFFVFTTTMSQSTAMAMFEPKDQVKDNEKELKASGAMTILLGKQNQVYYYMGVLDAATLSEQFKVTTFKDIRTVINDKRKATPKGDLMYIIKATDSSKFGNSMAIIDEMTICGVEAGHYAEDKVSGTERQLIEITEKKNNIQ